MTDPRRAAVLVEAANWLRTPYHHMGRVKGGGTDCLMLLAEVYEAAGVIPHVEIPFYPPGLASASRCRNAISTV